MLLLYILWDDWPIFIIAGSNEQLQQQLEYTLLKPDYHSWWISKMQSGCEDTLEERYTIKFCFKLGKNTTETYGMLPTSFGTFWNIEHHFNEWHKRLEEGRESSSEEASTLEIGSVAFPPGQCTSPQLHPCHRLFDGHRHSSSASLWSRPCSLWLLVIP